MGVLSGCFSSCARAPGRRGLLALLVPLLITCRGDSSGGGDTIIVGMRADFGAFNPVTASAQYDFELMNYALFTPLVQYDENLAVRPWLASSWELLGDTGVVFRLRDDVRWHDGPPVTAHDVVFTFELAKDPASASSLLAPAFLSQVASATALDDHTVAFRFAQPHAQALEDFWWPPLPRHLLQDVNPAELRSAPYNREPIGSGPFRFREWRANELLVLERNPNFPEALGGPAAAARIVFRIIPESSTMLTELLTNSIHVDIPLDPDQVRQVEGDADTELHAFPSRTVFYIGWNNARPPFDDVRVRRALAYAINRREIIDALLYGQGELAVNPIPPWHPLFPGNVDPVEYDLEQAQELLERAGWRDRDGDGTRENAQRQPLTFTLLASDDALRRSVAEVVQSQLRRAGVAAQLQVLEFQTMLQQHRAREFDAILTNWVLDNFQVAAAPLALFHSRQADIAQSPNRSSVRIPRLDAAMERAASSTSAATQREAWLEFTRILQQEQPVTFMFWLRELAASRHGVQGVRMDPRGEFMSIASWSLVR